LPPAVWVDNGLKMDQQPIRQAFGSPGGKTYLAPKIVKMVPPHTTYVEPFAGGAAVYFRKAPSNIEVLNDKDAEIAFAFQFLRDMTPQQFSQLKKYDWEKRLSLFYRLKGSKPKTDLERFRRFYYLRKASFGTGGQSFNHGMEGGYVGVDHLWRVHERLKRSRIYAKHALNLIEKYDSPGTFFYLDPPYPGRDLIGSSDKYTVQDLDEMVKKLRHIKGKFMLSLNREHAKRLPKNWHIKRVLVHRSLILNTGEALPDEYEIIATNYNPLPKFRQPTRPKNKYPEPERLLYR